MIWIDPPKWVTALIYLSLGWVAIAPSRSCGRRSARYGVPVAARRPPLHGGRRRLRAPRPDPNPAVFGYHEIFHLLVIAAAAVQYAASPVALETPTRCAGAELRCEPVERRAALRSLAASISVQQLGLAALADQLDRVGVAVDDPLEELLAVLVGGERRPWPSRERR